jgi:hypothetical protein
MPNLDHRRAAQRMADLAAGVALSGRGPQLDP